MVLAALDLVGIVGGTLGVLVLVVADIEKVATLKDGTEASGTHEYDHQKTEKESHKGRTKQAQGSVSV